MEQESTVIEIEDNGVGFREMADDLPAGMGMALSKAQFTKAFPKSRVSFYNNAYPPGCTIRLEIS